MQSNNQHYLPYPTFLLILGAVGLGIWSIFKMFPVPEPVSINEINQSGGSVSLHLSPDTVNITPNTNTVLSLNVNSNADRLSVVKFALTYDPTKLTISNLTKGSWLTQELSPLTISDGRITGELGAKPDTSREDGGAELTRTGSGTLLTFRAQARSVGVHTLSIDATNSNAWTITGDTAHPNNMLQSVSGATLTAETIVSPTPTATPNPTSTPTLKPTTKPLAKPSASPSLSPSPSPHIESPEATREVSGNALSTSVPTSHGSLSDIFKSTSNNSGSTNTSKLGFFQRILLGWQAIFQKLAELLN